jgi:hypothetical protein
MKRWARDWPTGSRFVSVGYCEISELRGIEDSQRAAKILFWDAHPNLKHCDNDAHEEFCLEYPHVSWPMIVASNLLQLDGRYFFDDQSGVFRYYSGGPATIASKPLG